MSKRKPLNAYRCPVHDGQIHGGEADELRSGLETLIDLDEISVRSVRRLLDRVDARDSLAHLEAQATRKRTRGPRRARAQRSGSVAMTD